jgi:hypothetical protein
MSQVSCTGSGLGMMMLSENKWITQAGRLEGLAIAGRRCFEGLKVAVAVVAGWSCPSPFHALLCWMFSIDLSWWTAVSLL